MKYITLDELLERKQELISEREERLKMTAVGYDNAIALIEELIQKAAARGEADDQGDNYGKSNE